MLLGIVLHSMMYLGGKGLYGGTMSFIHGFRMQLFFLVSGFFVVMLWRNKGLKALLKHRAKRLLLPIVVFIPLMVISTLWLLGLTEAWKNSDFLTSTISNRIYISGDNLFSATRSGDLEAIKKHLDNGSDVHKRDSLKLTPVHWAAINGQTNALKLLIEKGGDINVKMDGMTPLHMASHLGRHETVGFLVNHGADVNVEDKEKQTALEQLEKTSISKMRDEEFQKIAFFRPVFFQVLGVKNIELGKIVEGRRKVHSLLLKHTDKDQRKDKNKVERKGKRAERPAPPSEDQGVRPLKNFSYRVYHGQWDRLPDFEKLEPKQTGEGSGPEISGIIDLDLAERNKPFGMEFEGELEIKEAGEYTFKLGSDDGSRLFINGQQIIDNDGLHAMEYKEGSITLEPGDAAIRVQYFERGGANRLSLSVSGPGMENVYLSKYEHHRDGGRGDFMAAMISVLPGWAQGTVRGWRKNAGGGELAHLWFLNYLFWLVAGFAVVAWVLDRLKIKENRKRVSALSWRWLWLVPVILVLRISVVGEVISWLLWFAWWILLTAWIARWLVRKIKIKQEPLWRRFRIIPKVILMMKRISKKIHAPWRKLGLGYFVLVSLVALMMWSALPWLVVAFVVGACLVVKLKFKEWPAWIVSSPWCWLWLLLGTLMLQFLMRGFGPDTHAGIFPWVPGLLHYGIFFGFGALCFGNDKLREKAGRYWHVGLGLAIPAFFLGFMFMKGRNDTFGDELTTMVLLYHFLTSLFQTLFAWLMIFGMVGFFRRFFSEEKKWVRYLSDSSYWLYIGHLPLVLIFPNLFRHWGVPDFAGFVLNLGLSTGILLLMYHTMVRYTWVGTMLNGKRTRDDELQPSNKKRLYTLLLCIFTWFAGLHRFYARRYSTVALHLTVLFLGIVGALIGSPMSFAIALWVLLLWGTFDFLSILSGTYVDGEGNSVCVWR